MKISRKLNAIARDACGKRVGLFDEARIRKGVEDGMTNGQMAKSFGFSRKTITSARARLGLAPAKPGRPTTKQP